MQKRFVSIWFPHLAADWHTRKQPHLRNTAFVLKTTSQNRLVVAAANPLAQTQGVYVGMPLADAKAIFPQLLILDDKPGLTDQLLHRIAEWCIRFTPVASPDLPGGILLEATGCAHLWGGEDAYVADITKRLTAIGYTVHIAMADTIGAAWALARYGKNSLVVTGGQQMQALLPLPPSALRLENEITDRLAKLGLRRIEDFLSMPRSALRRRFGLGMIQRLKQAIGEEQEIITPIYPVEPYQERLPCIEPIVTLTGIEIAVQRLLETLCIRLRKEGKGLRSAYFRGYRVDGGTQGIEIGTAKASHNEAHLFYLFALKLSTIEPGGGIELFILEATKVEDYGATQERLWEGMHGLDNQQLAELMDRIAGKVGSGAIKRYLPAEHHLPERSFKQASSLDEQPATGWNTDRPRPLSLLMPPERIEVTAPIPDYPPMNFRYKGKLHKIIKADGPERIEQEWWIQEGEHRDYYAVEDEEGQRYWLFRLGQYVADKSHGWFIHGFFP
jgi:protein ImuB